MKAIQKIAITIYVAAMLGSAGIAAHAQAAKGSEAPSMSNASPESMSEGEVKKVDASAEKLTIKHGPLTNLDMGAMTMVFRVKDPEMLTQVKEGGKIKFIAEKVNGALTVTTLQVLK
jgi:Cu/Ag efflux protein CusF